MARLIPILLVSLLASMASGAEVETTAQRDARMEWWREARFGMFVHWGLYSGLAGTWEGKPVGTDGFTGRLDPANGDFITPEQHIPATGMPDVD